jgi:hypothetical protein
MSNLYNLTKQIHANHQKVCEKHGLEKVEIDSDYYYSIINGEISLYHITQNYWNGDSFYAIQADQIRQILVHLQGILGGNPEFKRYTNHVEEAQGKIDRHTIDIANETNEETKRLRQIWLAKAQVSWGILFTDLENTPKSQAKALDDKWLNAREDSKGKYQLPLFDTEPELVLTQLNGILENLLK